MYEAIFMSSLLFEKPILNSRCDHPRLHWELDASHQQNIDILSAPDGQVQVKLA